MGRARDIAHINFYLQRPEASLLPRGGLVEAWMHTDLVLV